MQLFYLSGILTVFFCGIVMSHYTWHNVTESSRVTTKYVPTKFLSCDVLGSVHFLNAQNSIQIIAGMLLQPCHLLLRLLSSFMLVWMPWTLRSGDS
jgi:NhaP-type Na+/H+ or K+/H+ antiporter